jgi:hypothetical protein
MSSSLGRRRVLVLTSAVATAALLVGCSSGSASKAKSTSTTSAPPSTLAVNTGIVNVVSASGPVEMAPADRKAVVAAIRAYVKSATVQPLASRPSTTPSPQLQQLFTTASVASLTGPEADSVSDTGIAGSAKNIRTTIAPVNIGGLADKAGAVDLIGATLDLTATAHATRGPITIHRTGELMFTRDGTTWKILGFTLAVTRSGAGLGPESPTASSTTGVKAP